jgi:hypothetical protein
LTVRWRAPLDAPVDAAARLATALAAAEPPRARA